jgi:hypothetical protein
MNARTVRTRGHRLFRQPFDEADWVDGDHWQAVEEFQDFRNGLDAELKADDLTDTADASGPVVRQIRRYGLQAGE